MPTSPETDPPIGSTDPVIVIREPGRVTLHLVLREPIEVGRACSGLLVDDRSVSRRHVSLRPDRDRVVVEDLGSANGTFVDGARIDAPVELAVGSSLIIGDTTIELTSGRLPRGHDDRMLDEPAPQTSIERVAAAAAERPDVGVDLQAGTRTIVFSDIEGSTERAVALGDAQWFDVLSAHDRVITDAVDAHGGMVVKSQGDGFMLAFDSARRAVRCMMVVQQQLNSIDPDAPEAVRIRVGAHTGEAIEVSDGDLFGQSVIIAARIANAATGGEILVSSLVREIIEPRGDIRFGPTRSVDLKGIAGGHLVHPIDWATV